MWYATRTWGLMWIDVVWWCYAFVVVHICILHIWLTFTAWHHNGQSRSGYCMLLNFLFGLTRNSQTDHGIHLSVASCWILWHFCQILRSFPKVRTSLSSTWDTRCLGDIQDRHDSVLKTTIGSARTLPYPRLIPALRIIKTKGSLRWRGRRACCQPWGWWLQSGRHLPQDLSIQLTADAWQQWFFWGKTFDGLYVVRRQGYFDTAKV